MSLLVRTEQKAGQPNQPYTKISFARALEGADEAMVESSQPPHIDSTNANRFEDVVWELLAQADKTDALLLVIVDLSNVPYISSAGLRVLAVLYKQLCQRNGAISLIVPHAIDDLEVSGLNSILQPATNEEAAVALLANRLAPKVPARR
jgi:stage II sporulation protein AA (anti-sigma F factor antagonist)